MFKKYFLIFIVLFSNTPAQIFNNNLEESILHTTDFILSDEYKILSQNHSNVELLDSIYKRTKELNNSDISETLLAMTFICFSFKEIPLDILNDTINIPLPFIDEKTFEQKRKMLPANVFGDTSKYDNKDKLSHFFGSAFLSFNDNVFNISEFIGILVELFEQAFKIDGAVDKRDLDVNKLGRFFGEILNKHESLLPSQVIKIHNYFLIPFSLGF